MPEETHITRPCPRCRSTRSRIQFSAGDYQFDLPGVFFVSRCDDCGLLFQNPALKPEFLGRHYPEGYSPYEVGEMSVEPSAQWQLRQHQGYQHLPEPDGLTPAQKKLGRWMSGFQLLPDFVPEGRLLEVGCAAGNRLAMMQKLGWTHCAGIEYSDHAAKLARARGFAVTTGPAEVAINQFADQSLDVIIASFVLEHFENPFAVMDQFAAKLRPGGQLLFSTLNINSPDFRIYQKYWYDLDLPRHFTFFRKEDLLAALQKDFSVVNVTYQPAANDYLGSARHRLKHGSNPLAKAFDRALLRLGNRLNRLWIYLARAGWATRICIHARKR